VQRENHIPTKCKIYPEMYDGLYVKREYNADLRCPPNTIGNP
jgi:hypothetical protein